MLNEVCDNIKAAIFHGRTDILRSMLDACDSNGKNGEITKEQLLNSKLIPEGTFLVLATQLNQADAVRNLLSNGANPNICDAYRCTSSVAIRQIYVAELLRATSNSEMLRVEQLLDAGIDVNVLDSPVSQNTPLHWAACYSTSEMINFLIARGASVNAVNATGATPLHDAVNRGDKAVCAELITGGADPYFSPSKGNVSRKSPYSLAQNKLEILDLIVNLAQADRRETNSSSDCSDRKTVKDTESIDLHGLGGLRRKSYLRSGTEEDDDKECSQPLLVSYKKTSSLDQSAAKSADWTEVEHPLRSPDWGESGRRRHISEGGGDLARSKGSSLLYSSQASSLDLAPRIEQMVETLHLSQVKAASKPIVTNPCLHLLWPQPQTITELTGPGFIPHKQLFISVAQGSVSIHRVLDVWEISRPALLALGYVVKIGDVQPSVSKFSSSPIECVVNGNLFAQDDAYQIHITSNKIHMTAASERGLHYSILTFTQLLKLSLDCPLPAVVIRDYSKLRHRALLLDISPRGRIPTLEYLFSMLDALSSLKITHVHLYTRLLPSCEWQLCYTKSELVALDRRAQDRFITLVPVLDVDDHVTTALLDSMWPVFQEVLTCFPNLSFIHLGPLLSSMVTQVKEVVEEPEETTSCCSHSANHSMVDSVLSGGSATLLRLCIPSTATIMLCANSLHTPHLARTCLPRNVILLEYGFQADYDFKEWSRTLHELGGVLGFCPGTASWNSLSGCPEAAICNIYSAVQAAVEENALGIVTAHWSGSHHLTPHPFAGPGFLLTAGLGWNPTTHPDYLQSSLGELLDVHILHDSAGVMGSAILELGYMDTYVVRCSRGQSPLDHSNLPDQEGSSLYKLLTDPDNVILDRFSHDMFGKVAKHVKKCQKDLLKAKLNCAYGDMVLQETMLSADLMLTACRIGRALLSAGVNPNSNMGLAVINLGVNNLPPTFRTDIANKLLAHIEQYKGTWLQRHLPAGLQTSLLILTSALHSEPPKSERASMEHF